MYAMLPTRPRRSPRKGGREKNCHVSTASCAVCSSLRTRRREETVTSVQPRVAVLSAVCCYAVCRCSCCHVRVPHLVVYLHVLCPVWPCLCAVVLAMLLCLTNLTKIWLKNKNFEASGLAFFTSIYFVILKSRRQRVDFNICIITRSDKT